jgi:hypothetical protein
VAGQSSHAKPFSLPAMGWLCYFLYFLDQMDTTLILQQVCNLPQTIVATNFPVQTMNRPPAQTLAAHPLFFRL